MQSTSPPDHPIEDWTDEELLDQYRYVKAELSQERPFNKVGDNRPTDVLVAEIERRGLTLPGGSSAASPGRA
jgi:hypothetical protein